MISLELAKELKEAGLKWEPKPGDWYFCKYGCVTLSYKKYANWMRRANRGKFPWQNIVFAPRLDQLLEQINQKEYKWKLINLYNVHYVCYIDDSIHNVCYMDNSRSFSSDILEDAVGMALLWILKKQNENDNMT